MSNRIKVIAGNWKMNKTNPEAEELVQGIKTELSGDFRTRVILCPPATALSRVSELVRDTEMETGAQNLHWEPSGAFTGELSAQMILSAGAGWVIIGHSERRQYFGETDETVNRRVHAALAAGLKVIMCVGESLEEREAGSTMEVVERQLRGGLEKLETNHMSDVIIAYEPVWAIGTGKTATPEQAQEVHAFLREQLKRLFDRATADHVVIQYGGSVKPDNAEELLLQPDIDGALVGGACLKVDSFAAIIRAAEKVMG